MEARPKNAAVHIPKKKKKKVEEGYVGGARYLSWILVDGIRLCPKLGNISGSVMKSLLLDNA